MYIISTASKHRTYDIKICIHNILSTAAHDTMTFAYDMTICILNKMPTSSNLMIKAQDTMTFACEIIYVNIT